MKNTAEVYEIHSENYPGEWAIVTVQEKIGLFSVVSSYGNYSHIWNSRGSSTVKEFVQDLDYDYFFGKTSSTHGKVFCPESSFLSLKKAVLEARRERCIDKFEAECAWRELRHLKYLIDDGIVKEESQYISNIMIFEELHNAVTSYDTNVVRYKKDPQCVSFWNKLWPTILEVLREDS